MLARKPEPSDFSKVLCKANGQPTLALVDLQTQWRDLIDSKFVHRYRIPTRPSQKKTLTTVIKGLQRKINKEFTMELDLIEYLAECTFYVAHVSEWDIIFEQPALSTTKV